ncbi:hypothetical protein C7J88_08365 [Staphylococcus muscae]|uniref:Protein vraC n=1 Tax=Staphylococcus muscae TaxID=1294 RepID=A0A240BV22_9STAP|nr:hypothetical protein [Staphylococcus muscae]AVQ34173.1 hypothetical protein C7J88_08365 [Staphylococcus muscae]PNZ03476.1 hypothetical protein CD131_06115 [Staphylococcus muscae]GGA85516.1 hypothetical protein GCM10007183_07130 [Staphylococcus muscae]SNV99212.1 protein vraC [Staphylococcus muscae]
MPHYSNVGHTETRYIKVDQTTLHAYQTLFDIPLSQEIPLLFFARYWCDFTLFQSFIETEIMLVETVLKEAEKLFCYETIKASLTYKSVQQVKNFEQFQFELVLNDNNVIQQTFIRRDS